MRVAHITDLHVEVVPRVGQLVGKRLIGAVNLYVLGRHTHFDVRTVEALVEAVVAVEPALVVCTGDLTATSTPEEFARAAVLLAPITRRFPFVVLPGNHDVYTAESVGRFRETFGEWANDGELPFVRRFGGVDWVAVDSARPHWLSRGRVGPTALERLDTLLARDGEPAVVMVHYPLRGRSGAPYGPATRNLEDATALEAVLARHPRVVAILHGHEHHGYRTTVGGVPSYDPGASGYAWMPARRRTAHFNLYDVDETGIVGVERQAWDGTRFAPETGGAYATGG